METSPAKPLPPPDPDRDIQRGALRDLVALSTESAATESEVERENRSSTEQEKRSFGDRNFQLQEQYKKQTAEIVQQNEQLRGSITQQHANDKAKITQADRAYRKKAEAEKQSIDEKVKKKFDQSVWEADSVHEMSGGQIGATYKQSVEQANADDETLNGIEVKSAELVQRYGVPLPTDEVQTEDDPAIVTDASGSFTRHHEAADQLLTRLHRMPLANIFVGIRPYVILLLATGGAAAGVLGYFGFQDPQQHAKELGIFGGGTFVLLIVIGIVIRTMATKQVRAVHIPLRKELALARKANEQRRTDASQKRETESAAAKQARNKEVQNAKTAVAPHAAKAAKERDQKLAAAQAEFVKQIARIDKSRDAALLQADENIRRAQHDLDHKLERAVKDLKVQHEARLVEIDQRYKQRRADLEAHWTEGLKLLQAPIDRDGQTAINSLDWNDPAWKTWTPPKKFASRVRFGEMHVDLQQIAENVPKSLTLPASFSLPALLAFPAHASLLIHSDHAGRPEAIRTLQMMMARLLTSLPPGRVRFTIIDPVGLGQNFAGFMHLTDYEDALVGGRIWTSQEQIEEKLRALADHMENVIQKYLRNEFATIDEYNAQAGELAEPYRFLVVADLPTNFSTDSFRRLSSIAASGARCGVYTLVSRDTRAALPAGGHIDELRAHSVNLVRQGDQFVWDDEVFRQLPLKLDAPAPENVLTEILHKVGLGAKAAKRVEVPFEIIAPKEGQMWTKSTTTELDVAVGRTGATRFQSLKLGKGTSQHVLIAGKTGSGKSTLMHAMITNAALWYSPDEVELYLVDFKKGVEFKTYATNLLPHARAIAIESDREFGLSLLTRLDQELTRRGELFRKAGGAQNLEMYRATPNHEVIPRTLLIIDEYQEFFTEDDRLAQDATLLIERLVRQGRAFGMHVLLGSQTAGGLPRGVMDQFAVRIALATTEAGSQIILGDNNSAARLLSRPGEAIYNDGGGLVENNSPFQVAYLSDAKRDVYLADLASKAEPYFKRFGYPIVFEGNAAADTTRNSKLNAALDAPSWPRSLPGGALAWLGEPVAIKDPTAIQLRRNAGVNVLAVGQAEEQAMAMFNMMMVSIAAQQGSDRATFYVLDGTPADSGVAGAFEKVKAAIPNEVKMIDYRATGEAIDEVSQEMLRRQEADLTGTSSIYVIIFGLHRYRVLRKQEDEFSFSTSDEPKKANPGKQFAELLKEGPPLGIHVIAWSDTLVALDRILERGSMREFDNRILFQMSAADSSNLIDSPAANKLGANRAVLYSEEQGIMERFRPYALPDAKWLAQVRHKLGSRGVPLPSVVETDTTPA